MGGRTCTVCSSGTLICMTVTLIADKLYEQFDTGTRCCLLGWMPGPLQGPHIKPQAPN